MLISVLKSRSLFRTTSAIVQHLGYALLCLLVLAGMHHVRASQPDWRQLADPLFQHIAKENGLPHPLAATLAEDAEGFLWVGTQGGLARWDGYRFRAYLHNPKDPSSVPDGAILSLHTDQRGRLWVGSRNNGLVWHDSTQGRFVRIRPTAKGLLHTTISAITNDGADGIWIGSQDDLAHIVPKPYPQGKIASNFQYDEKNIKKLPKGIISSLLMDSQGQLWVGSSKGLFMLNSNTNALDEVSLPVPALQEAVSHIYSLAESADGRIWVGTKMGVFVIDAATHFPRLVPETACLAAISFIQEAMPGQMWVGCIGKGIMVLDAASMQIQWLQHDASLPTSIADNTPRSALRDRSGLIWIGSQHGLSRHDPSQTAIFTLFGGGTRQGSITDPNVTSVAIMPDNSIWLGLQNKGVNIIDASNQFREWRNIPNGSQVGRVYSNTSAYNNALYIGSVNGIFRTDTSAAQVQAVHVPPRDPTLAVYALLVEGNLLWIGGNDGLWQVDLNDINKSGQGKAIRVPGTESLNQQQITVLTRDKQGTLWMGSRTGGLFRFDPISQQLQTFPVNPAEPDMLSTGFISSLLQDSRGRLWVGTQGGGIHMLPVLPDIRNRKVHFTRITEANGLPNNMIDKLLEDQQGRIWASTDDGLAMIDAATSTFGVYPLQRPEGVVVSGYWINAGGITKNGELLFGGLDGLTVVRPEQFKPWTYSPPVVITQIQVGGETLAANPYNHDTLANSFFFDQVPQNKLLIQPTANSISVEFSSLDYSAPERNRYTWRLDGFDKSWNSGDASRRLATYTNLPPGDYTLRLRGSNRNGLWANHERVIPIRVLPAWHQTVWFMALVLLGVSSAIYGVFRLRSRFFKKMIAARTADILKLGKIGQELTSTLDAEQAFELVYKQVSARLDASVFTIGIYRQENAHIEFVYEMEGYQRQPVTWQDMKETDRPAVWCVRERRELVVAQKSELLSYVNIILPPPTGRETETVVYLPLMIEQRVIGCLSVQSPKQNAYDQNQLEFLRVLANYAAIALSNSIAHGDLAKAHKRLQETQQQMVLQEKMAGLGTLTAGIAHEINNPTNFVHVAAQIQRTEIVEFQHFVASLIEDDENQEVRQAFDERFKKLDSNVTLMLNGTERIKGIVQDLRAFTRMEQSGKKTVRLSTCLNSTLNLVRTSWLEHVEFITVFTDDPEIECWPALLNQVFMNLLINACQAIAEKQQQAQANSNIGTNPTLGKLWVRLQLSPENKTLEVTFEDSGNGIDEKIQARILEPFFTTKEVGAGTGLGLSIAFGIVQKHGGTLTFSSILGMGSQFIVSLPLPTETNAANGEAS